MNTAFLPMAQDNGAAIFPVETVCRWYFSRLTVEPFERKVTTGEIRIPLARVEESQKAIKGGHLADLAADLAARRAGRP
jgi:hypothetical protein